MTCVGIDVGATELVLAVRHKKKVAKTKTFKNDIAGHKAIRKLCSKYHKYGQIRIGVEATGSYHFDLAVALYDNHQKNQLMVINPRATYAFAQADMQRCKTDKVDAATLALFVERMDYPLWEKPSDNLINLRCTSRTMASYVIDKAKAHNNLHALSSCSKSPNTLIESLQRKIQFLEHEIEKMKCEALDLIQQDALLKQHFDLLITIPGFGELTALQMIAETMIIPEGLTNKQWVALAGLDPRKAQSGTSINKQTHISKAGNKHIRRILFLPALSAIKSNPYVKGFFKHLIENRKIKKMQAVVAVMRKLLHAVHALINTQKPFDNTRFFKEPAMS